MHDEMQVRLEKLERLKALEMLPYPSSTARTHQIGEVLERFEALQASAQEVVVAGRVMITRVHGGMMFADLVDQSGKLQLTFKQDEIGNVFDTFRDLIDPADSVEAHGTVFVTKRGERSLSVKQWKILSKALLPLPDKWHGLQDVELRFRKRYLDLLMNDEVKTRLLARSKIISAIRRVLDERGFIEVETPTL